MTRRFVGGDPEALLEHVLHTTTKNVRLVVARRELPTSEAVALREGQVLTFASEVPPVVELRVDRVTIARGQLVDIEGRRGVRVTELAEPEQ